jgi:hypothetical protein
MPDKQPATKHRFKWFVGFIVIMVALAKMGGAGSGDVSAPGVTTTAAAPAVETAPAEPKGPSVWDAGATFHTTKGQPVCISGNAYVEMVGYLRDNDEGAMKELFNSGQCGLAKEGVVVSPKRRPEGLGMFEGQGLIEARVLGHRQMMVLDRHLLQEKPE